MLNGIIIALLCFVFGPIPVIGGWVGFKAIEDDDIPIWISVGLVAFGVAWAAFMQPWFVLGFQEGWTKMIGLSIPLAFPAAVLVEPYRRGMMFMKPKSLDERVEEERARIAAQQQRNERRAEKTARSQGSGPGEHLGVGTLIKGESIPSHVGIYRDSRWVVLDEKLLDQHMFILGATGAGKSETIKRLIWEIAHKTDRDIFLVDGKGEDELAQEVRNICYHTGRGDTPIFRMGTVKPGQFYNGFMGSAEDIFNRLCAMVVDSAI